LEQKKLGSLKMKFRKKNAMQQLLDSSQKNDLIVLPQKVAFVTKNSAFQVPNKNLATFFFWFFQKKNPIQPSPPPTSFVHTKVASPPPKV